MERRASLLRHIIWLCIIFPLQLAGQNNADQNSYTIKHFTPEDGLGALAIRSIVQDRYGFLWTGSRDVISRYDGYNFKKYNFDPEKILGVSYTGGILSLHTDHAGDVWIRSEIFSKYDPGIDGFIHYKPEIDLSEITSVVFDLDHQTIWFGGANGLFSFNVKTSETKTYLTALQNEWSQIFNGPISHSSDQGNFLLIGSPNGLWKFDKKNHMFSRPACLTKDSTLLFQNPVWHIFDSAKDNQEHVWVYLANKLIRLDEKFNITHHYTFPSGFQSVNQAVDKNGAFWLITPKNGFCTYNPYDSSLRYLRSDPGAERLSKEIFIDREQNIWSSTESHGLHQFIPRKLIFNHIKFENSGTWAAGSMYQSNGNDHLALVRTDGRTNEVWTAGPIVDVDLDPRTFHKVEIDRPIEGFVLSTSVGKNHLWLCSWGRGITSYPIGTSSGAIETSAPNRYVPDVTSQHKIRPLTGAVFEDHNKQLWIASRNHGVSVLDPNKPYGEPGSVRHYLHNDSDTTSLAHNYVWKFSPENENSVWVITWNSLDLFQDGHFKHLFKHIKKPRSVLKLSDDTLMIGTSYGMFEAVKTGGHYKAIQTPFLSKYHIYDMTSDELGRLWIYDFKQNLVVCYDRKEKIAIEFGSQDNLPSGITFITKTSKGLIVLISGQGFSLFDPRSLKVNRAKTTTVLTSLKINNETPLIDKDLSDTLSRFAISNSISVIKDLVLDYRHNNISIEFSAMELADPEKNLYRYKLEGFDVGWVESDYRNRTATYTNLDPGKYTFRVSSSNYNGIWSDHERLLSIQVLPPPWQTWWAYTLYALALITLVLAWRRYDIKRVKLKHRAEHLSELDQLKSRFFANISHEFRTPITLILGPLKDLYSGRAKQDPKTVLGSVIRNGERLHRLINQLLDLSKIEAGKMQLHASAIDLVQFLRETASAYESLATEKKIKYVFYPEQQELIVYIDQDKIEKVVHNLLSNAFKFTKPGGEVILNLKAERKQCSIVVKDTGIGIPADQLTKVFDRFYQVDSSQTRGYEGSGLGMALAKELVELHRGRITVESIEGKGTTFTVTLPLGKEHLNKNEISDIVYHKEAESLSELVVSAGSDEEPAEVATSQEKSVVLIVEDNADMRRYIRSTLSDHYRILEAENGKAGILLAQELIPDLILSDIMMPGMDGYQLCEAVKTHELTSHIPVILLTAKADRESRLTGLETGADDYLSKPFDADELKLIIRNRIEERRKLRERFSREITLEPKEVSITSMDEKFLLKVLALIEQHMDDENFSIDELSREAGFSNMHFYRKIKALSGQTPSQFLRTIRLKRAAELLAKNSDNVTQIAYSVGFGSLSYFNKCFKERFGVTPGQYVAESPKSTS